MKPLVVLVALAVLTVIGACTFVYVRGNSNTIDDTGGHGGGIELPGHAASESGPIQRFFHPGTQH
jgi:hypothetical protein